MFFLEEWSRFLRASKFARTRTINDQWQEEHLAKKNSFSHLRIPWWSLLQKQKKREKQKHKKRLDYKSHHSTLNYNPLSIWSTTAFPVNSLQSLQLCAITPGIAIFFTSSGRSRILTYNPALTCQAMWQWKGHTPGLSWSIWRTT